MFTKCVFTLPDSLVMGNMGSTNSNKSAKMIESENFFKITICVEETKRKKEKETISEIKLKKEKEINPYRSIWQWLFGSHLLIFLFRVSMYKCNKIIVIEHWPGNKIWKQKDKTEKLEQSGHRSKLK